MWKDIDRQHFFCLKPTLLSFLNLLAMKYQLIFCALKICVTMAYIYIPPQHEPMGKSSLRSRIQIVLE